MKNYVQDGNKLTIKAPYDVASGQILVLHSLFGVAIVDAPLGEEVTVNTQGVYELEKDGEQVTQGTRAYFHEEKRLATTTSSHQVEVEGEPDGDGNPTISTQTVHHPLIGIFVKDARARDEKAEVKLASAPC